MRYFSVLQKDKQEPFRGARKVIKNNSKKVGHKVLTSVTISLYEDLWSSHNLALFTGVKNAICFGHDLGWI